MKKSNKKNQGFSLVEMLVSVAVLAIAMTGIVGLINIASKYYSNSHKEVELQAEVQTTFSQLSNMLIDSNAKVDFDDTNKVARIICDGTYYIVAEKDKKLYVKSGAFDSATKLPGSREVAIKGMSPSYEQAGLLCEHVEFFKVDTSHYEQGYITVALHLKYGSREASINKNVFLRNYASRKKNIISACAIDALSASGTSLKIGITQNTGKPIPNGTMIQVGVVVRCGGGGTLSVSNMSVTGGTVRSFDPGSGIVIFEFALTTEWESGTKRELSLNIGKTPAVSECNVDSVSY